MITAARPLAAAAAAAVPAHSDVAPRCLIGVRNGSPTNRPSHLGSDLARTSSRLTWGVAGAPVKRAAVWATRPSNHCHKSSGEANSRGLRACMSTNTCWATSTAIAESRIRSSARASSQGRSCRSASTHSPPLASPSASSAPSPGSLRSCAKSTPSPTRPLPLSQLRWVHGHPLPIARLLAVAGREVPMLEHGRRHRLPSQVGQRARPVCRWALSHIGDHLVSFRRPRPELRP